MTLEFRPLAAALVLSAKLIEPVPEPTAWKAKVAVAVVAVTGAEAGSWA